jgi:hypothetical protein
MAVQDVSGKEIETSGENVENDLVGPKTNVLCYVRPTDLP